MLQKRLSHPNNLRWLSSYLLISKALQEISPRLCLSLSGFYLKSHSLLFRLYECEYILLVG